MAITISATYIKTFEANVRHLAQQGKTRLRPFCDEKDERSHEHTFERVGSVEMSAKSGSRQATPTDDTPWSNRIAVPATYDVADSVEPEDTAQTLQDPTSNIAKAHGKAAGRCIDDIIIAALGGNALDTDQTPHALPAGQLLGSAATAVSLDLLTDVAELFLTQDIDPDEEKVAVVSPNFVKQVLNVDKLTSTDYVAAKALMTSGYVSGLLGFDWICSTRLPAPGVGERYNYFFTKTGAMGLLVAKDIWTKAAEDPSLSFATRIYTALTMGAVRIEDERVVQVHILES